MKPDDLFKPPQPPYVWKLATTALIGTSLFIFITHNYHVIFYIDAFLSFIVSIVDITFKYREIRNLRINKRKIIWFSNKFFKESGLLSLMMSAMLLYWGSLFTGYVLLIMGVPMLIAYLYMAIVELRALMSIFRPKSLKEGNNL